MIRRHKRKLSACLIVLLLALQMLVPAGPIDAAASPSGSRIASEPVTDNSIRILSDRDTASSRGQAPSEIGSTTASRLPAAKAPLLPANQSPSFTFTAGGDYGTGSDVDKVLAGIAGSGSNFSLIIGDLSYNSVSPESSWCNYIKTRLGATYPVELLVGNHEDGSPYESYGGAIDTFAGCLPDRIGGLTGTYAHEYYFDYPQASPLARFILMEPDEYRNGSFVNYAAGTARYNWVAAAIDDAHTKGIKWVIAGMHKIYLDMGPYRGDSLDGGDGIGPDLFNLFLSKKVDLVLQAHYHTYQRTKQLALSTACSAISNNSYNSACVADANAAGAFVKGKGTVDVINGAGGFSLYDIDTSRPEAPYFAKWMGNNVNKSYGYLKITVSSSQLAAQFVPTTGTFTDSFSITDNSSGSTATPTSTSTAVPATNTPTWTPTTAPATNTPTRTPTTAPATNTPTRTPTTVPATSTSTPTFVPTLSPTPTSNPGGATLLFDDEFSGTSLDTSKWTKSYWWGCTIATNNELEAYMPDAVLVGNGLLTLRAEKRTVTGSDGKTYSYSSGAVTTGRASSSDPNPDRFSYKYGYAEMRAKMPKGKGLWPALWLLSCDQSWPPEIDITEIIGDQINVNNMTVHDASGGSTGGEWIGPDFSADFHTFGMSWQPNAIIWYVDGVERWRFTDAARIPAETMYLLANLAVGGDWPGSPDASTVFPADYQIDYIRVWDKMPTGSPTPTSTPTFTPTATRTLTPTATATAVITPTATSTSTFTPTATRTLTPTATATSVITPTATSTPTKTPVPPTSTNTPISPTSTPTNTPVPPTATRTPVPPTNTPTNTPVPPTATKTPVPPTSTPTNTPVPPTATRTSVPPTNTPTNTPVPPTSTPTNTPVPPTATRTPVPPTNTPTNTPVPPTATRTPVPPTNTPTNTPVPPTATRTPVPPTNTPPNTPVPPTATRTPVPPTNTPTNTPVLPTATNTPVTPGRTLLFSDDFDGTAINAGKWTTCYWWNNNGCTVSSNNELEWYQPSDVIVSNGTLKLQAEKRTVKASDGKTYNYTSGVVTTGKATWQDAAPDKFAFKYGYAEILAKVPKGKGLWPSFWMLSADQNWPPEIDAFTTIGQTPNIANFALSYLNTNGTEGNSTSAWTGPDFTAGWHTFAVDWQPSAMVWYVDGVERWRITDKARIPSTLMYLVLNLAVGGDWPGAPDGTTVFPSRFEVDYIKVWNVAPGGQTTPTPIPTPTRRRRAAGANDVFIPLIMK